MSKGDPQKPPRPWADMWSTHRALGGSLLTLLMGEEAAAQLLMAMLDKSNEARAWWGIMWSLPPNSEARKAAFTLGQAALLIERWRSCVTMVLFRPDDGFPICEGWMIGPDDGKTPLQTSEENARALPAALAIGHAAEALLRIAAWYIDDARGEAHGRTLGVEPSIPPHERVYERERGASGIAIGGRVYSAVNGHHIARAALADHFEHRRGSIKGSPTELAQRFTETAIASLPDGPWVMTSVDVSRFLDMILEELFCMCDVPGGVGPICDKCGKRCRGSRGRSFPEKLPGAWQRATHRTRGGDLEIRERADGRFDLRAVGKEPLGWPMPDQVAERGVDAAYVRAEIMVLP